MPGASLGCRKIKTMRPCGDCPSGAGDEHVNYDSDISYDEDRSKEAERRQDFTQPGDGYLGCLEG